MKKLLLLFFISFFTWDAHAQDSTAKPKKLIINGYIKDLQTLSFDKDLKNAIAGDLIHNRINVKWMPSRQITGVIELRNRLFWGEEVKLTPDFASQLRSNNEYVNMQQAWINTNSMVLHTNTERLYFDYRDEKLNIRVGRQRINWGLTTTWNPNDIFNAYNFLDFDYEERPGVDGGRCRYIFTNSFNIELAYAHTDQQNGNIAAIKYSLNKWNYDMQLITGSYKDHPTIGAGWAGYIKDAGFKGEAQYFFRNKDSAAHLNLSLEGDYMFKKGWYVNIGFLYNDLGLYRPVNNWDVVNLNLSPENLMPTKWNIIVTSAKEVTPLLSANMSILYAPGTNLLILFPSFQYNMATNLDVSLVWQSFFAELNNSFEGAGHKCYLRLKWSF